LQLSDVIEKITKNIKTKARIFQALRIETNNELENLEKSLSDAIDLLEKD
jgi:16S rRNA C1402 N4-methylase RsmH